MKFDKVTFEAKELYALLGSQFETPLPTDVSRVVTATFEPHQLPSFLTNETEWVDPSTPWRILIAQQNGTANIEKVIVGCKNVSTGEKSTLMLKRGHQPGAPADTEIYHPLVKSATSKHFNEWRLKGAYKVFGQDFIKDLLEAAEIVSLYDEIYDGGPIPQSIFSASSWILRDRKTVAIGGLSQLKIESTKENRNTMAAPHKEEPFTDIGSLSRKADESVETTLTGIIETLSDRTVRRLQEIAEFKALGQQVYGPRMYERLQKITTVVGLPKPEIKTLKRVNYTDRLGERICEFSARVCDALIQE